MLAPVVLFVYNRANHTKRTVEALTENYLAKETKLYVFSDGSKDELDKKNVELTRSYIDSIMEEGNFKEVEVVKSCENKGLAKSVIEGVNQVLKEYDNVIVLEDDLITTKYFLTYMNDALRYYKENNKIWSISGFNIPIKIPESYEPEVYLSYRASSWGWGTWKDRWKQVDWFVSDYNEFKENPVMRKNLTVVEEI